jgi:hypothetical protein
MRGFIVLALAAVATPASADMSMPETSVTPAWVAKCSARLEQARAVAAKRVPVFALARVEGAELWLDETILGGSEPAYFDALVVSRRSLWSDPDVTLGRWQEVAGPGLSQFRQTTELEGSVVAYQLDRWAPPALVRRVVDAIFKPAVDDCLAFASAE